MEYKYWEIVGASNDSQEVADKEYPTKQSTRSPYEFVCKHPKEWYIVKNGDDIVVVKYISNKKPEEKKWPKYKVWDYVVIERYTTMFKINAIQTTLGWIFRYNGCTEDELRAPTEEELKLYFR